MTDDRSDLWASGPGLLKALRRYWKLVVAASVICAGLGYGLSFLLPTLYAAEATVILSDPRNAGVFRENAQIVIDPNRYVRNQAQRIESVRVMERAAELEGGTRTAKQVGSMVTASPATNLDLITVRAEAPDPELAASLANSVVAAYEQIVVEDVANEAQAALEELDRTRGELEARVAELDARLDADTTDAAARAERDAVIARVATLRDRAEQIAVDSALYGSGVEVFDQAEAPSVPASPNKRRNGLVAGLVGLLAAGGFAWWRAEKVQTADDRHDPAAIVRAPLLGEIFDLSTALVGGDALRAGPHAAEAYQLVFASLDQALDAETVLVAVTSADKGDGKTVTSLNIAGAAAKTDRSVLLVDGDERMRGLTTISELPAEPGLTDLVEGRATLDDCRRGWRLADGTEVSFLPGGRKLENPSGFFSTTAFRDAMASMRKAADVVFVDTPPILAVADASAIAARSDGVVLVISRGVPLSRLQEVRARLDSLGTPLLGYVFNRADASRARYRYGFGYRHKVGPYGYGYGYEQVGNGEPARSRGRQPAEERADRAG